MSDDFLAKLLNNPARAKLLRAFAFNASEVFTLAQIARKSGVSTTTAQKEIKTLENMGLIKKGKLSIKVGASGKRIIAAKQKELAWTFDNNSKHAAALVRFVHEASPVQYKNIIAALKRAGRVSIIILSGSFLGDPTRPADLIVASDGLNENRLEQAIKTLEPQYGWEIRYAAFSTPELKYRLTIQDRLVRDTMDFPHLVLLDKTRLL